MLAGGELIRNTGSQISPPSITTLLELCEGFRDSLLTPYTLCEYEDGRGLASGNRGTK